MGNALVSLYRKMLLFDWCTEYARTHPTIADPKSFKLSDEEYQEFLAWLGKQDFEFQTATERSIDELEEIAKKEKYDNHLKSQLAALKKAYQAMEMDDLVAHEEEIRILIEDEIVSRYYYEAGRIAHSLQSDPEVQEAVNLLGNPTEYMNVLKLVKD
jgi:carboxyl-terminal processing protease